MSLLTGPMFRYKGQTRGPVRPIEPGTPFEFYITHVEAGTTLNDAHLKHFRGGWPDPTMCPLNDDRIYRVAQTMSRDPRASGGRGLGWEAKRYCKYVYGITEKGERVSAMVLYEEAFMIEFPDFITTKENVVGALSQIEEELSLTRGTICTKKNVDSFAMRYRICPYIPADPEHPNEPRRFPSVRLGVTSPSVFKKVKDFLLSKDLLGPSNFVYRVTLHELRNTVDPCSRMLREFEVKPCTWCVAVDPAPFQCVVALTEVQFHCTQLVSLVETADRPVLPPEPFLRYTCIDAEAVFGDAKEVADVAVSNSWENPPFPKPDHPTSSSVQWSIVTVEDPTESPTGILLELRDSHTKDLADGFETVFKGVSFKTYFFDNESDMLESLIDWIRFIDPDVVVSFYGHGFDFPWALRSNKSCSKRFYGGGRFTWDCQEEVYVRSLGKRVRMHEAAGIEGEKIMPVMCGRIMFDLLDYLMNQITKYPGYKLEYFAQKWLGEGKAGFDRKIDIPLAWHGLLPRKNYNETIGKADALPDGVEPTLLQQRALLRNYCVYDSVLPIRIIIARFEGQMRATATLTYVPLCDVINKKNLRLIVSKVTDVAWSIGAMVNEVDADLPTDAYDGGHVFEPKKGYYGEGDPKLPLMDPQPTVSCENKVCFDGIPKELLKWHELAVTVPTLDFMSLYPSIILAHGMCIMRLLDDGSLQRRLYPSEQSTLKYCKMFGLDPPPPSIPKKGLPVLSLTEMRLHGPGVWLDNPIKDDYTAVISYNPKKPEKAPAMYWFSKRWSGIFVPMLRSVLTSRAGNKKVKKVYEKIKYEVKALQREGDSDDPRDPIGFLLDMKEIETVGTKEWIVKKRALLGPDKPFPMGSILGGIQRNINVMDARQLADKGLANATYGATAFAAMVTAVSCRPVASSICAIGRQMLIKSHDSVLDHYPLDVKQIIYGDSVAEDTPVLVRHDSGQIRFVRICDLGRGGAWAKDIDGKDYNNINNRLEVWSDHGWTKVRGVVRHAVEKKMYWVRTPFGMVECTEDHSLLLENGTPISPARLLCHQRLMHTEPPHITDEDAEVSDPGVAARAGMLMRNTNMELEEQHMLFGTLEVLKAYIIGRYGSLAELQHVRKTTLLGAAQLSFAAHRLGFGSAVMLDDNDTYCIGTNIYAENTVHEICRPEGTMVYDLDTEFGHFAVGPGKLVVHNTDSIMVELRGKTFQESFEWGRQAEKYLTEVVFGAYPDIVMEFETLEYKFLSVGKKRYATESYKDPDKPPEPKVKGLAVVRGGDFPPVCTVVMQKMLDICSECGGLPIEAITWIAVLELGRHLESILDGSMPMEQYIMSKSIGTTNPKGETAPEHLRVARKMEKRFGIPVVMKAKIDYVYVIGDNDGVDHPTCVKYEQIDRIRYLEQRIRNTISEIMILMKVPANTVHAIFDMYSKALSEHMSPAVRGGFFKPSSQTAEQRLDKCVQLLHHPPELMPIRKRDAATQKALKEAKLPSATSSLRQPSMNDFFALSKKKKE